MPEPTDQIPSTFADVRLPALTYSRTALKQALASPATDHGTLAAVIGMDPGLTVRLLQALAQAPRKPLEQILEPSRIIGLIGLASVHKLVASTPVLEDTYRGPALLGLQKAYSRSLHAACYARTLATLRGRTNNEAEATVALLQNLGSLAVWEKKPGTMAALEAKVKQPEDMDLIGERQLGFTPASLGRSLITRWALPDQIAKAQFFHNSFDNNVQLPLLASALAWATQTDWRSDQSEELIQLCADLTRLHPDMVRSRLHREAAHAARAADDRNLPHTIDSLLAIPSDYRKPETEPEPRPLSKPVRPKAQPATPAPTEPKRTPKPVANKQTEQEDSTPKPAKTEPSTPQRPKPNNPAPTAVAKTPPSQTSASTPVKAAKPRPTTPVPTAAKPEKKPADDRKGSPPKPNPLQEKITIALNLARQRTGLKRILFAMLTPDRQFIRGRFVAETSPSELSDFQAPARSKNLFALLMAKPAALWVNGDNQLKYLPLIPGEVAGLINTGNFLTVSVVVQGKPIGLLYADNGFSALEQQQFAELKSLSGKLATLFAKR